MRQFQVTTTGKAPVAITLGAMVQLPVALPAEAQLGLTGLGVNRGPSEATWVGLAHLGISNPPAILSNSSREMPSWAA
ncbi:MAG: hypothetical protein JJE35_03715 [Thermoleophilia bacterium]|nr:hypothetical protein [Thermoleophilia bacterium]